jgi:S-adenosylmethionine decarboxylase proenzyme
MCEFQNNCIEGYMGSHLLLDLFKCKIDLNDLSLVSSILERILFNCDTTILDKKSHQFQPQGISIIFLLSESHLSIHTWPELNSCSIDFYHCGSNAHQRLEKAKNLIIQNFCFNDSSIKSRILSRG